MEKSQIITYMREKYIHILLSPARVLCSIGFMYFKLFQKLILILAEKLSVYHTKQV